MEEHTFVPGDRLTSPDGKSLLVLRRPNSTWMEGNDGRWYCNSYYKTDFAHPAPSDWICHYEEVLIDPKKHIEAGYILS